MMLTLIPKSSENPSQVHPNNDVEKYYKLSNIAPIWEPFVRDVNGDARFFYNLFFGTSGGTRLDRCWASPGTPLVRFY